MDFLAHLAAITVAGSSSFALYVCFRIIAFNDFRWIRDEDGTALDEPLNGQRKFAALYGISGVFGIALILFELARGIATKGWVLVLTGALTVFTGARYFVIRSHKESICNRYPKLAEEVDDKRSN